MNQNEEDLDMYGHIIDKHAYGGWTVRVQHLKRGEVATCSGFDLGELEKWLEDNYPQSILIHEQV